MAISLNSLTELIKFNRSQPSIEEDELSKNLCPECDWPLKENSKGDKVCPICGTLYT